MSIFKNPFPNPYFEHVQDIDPKELLEHLSEVNKVILVDVRQKEEFNSELGHIDHAQLHELGHLPQTLPQLPKDKTIVFICHSGGRSAKACHFAMENGFASVYNLQGGMLLWNQLNLPTTTGPV